MERFGVEGTGEIILVDDNASCSSEGCQFYLPRRALRGLTMTRFICSLVLTSPGLAALLNR